MRAHWTQRSIRDFVFRIAADFIAQLEKKMEAENITQDKLAERLKITKGRVSQVLNHPGNLSLAILAKYARALGMKMSIVAYEDGDPENIKGPIDSEIFEICWERSGKPRDFWAFRDIEESKGITANQVATMTHMTTPESAEFSAFLPRAEDVIFPRKFLKVDIRDTTDRADFFQSQLGAANSTENQLS